MTEKSIRHFIQRHAVLCVCVCETRLETRLISTRIVQLTEPKILVEKHVEKPGRNSGRNSRRLQVFLREFLRVFFTVFFIVNAGKLVETLVGSLVLNSRRNSRT
jgi:hypothetical protein